MREKKYYNFTDLSNYVIDCDRHHCFDFDAALNYVNKRYDIKRKMGCSALATRADNGDVLIGRNLDLTCSQLPCYISHVKYGKYDTLNFTYDELFDGGLKYEELLKVGKIDDEYFNAIPMLATDSMNSEGLYIEYNMREYEEQFICFGTNPGAEIRVGTYSIPFLVASNCATVKEAIEYLNTLDLYTLVDKTIASGWNLCCMIGDAKGHYGLIEIAHEEIKYLPQQHGQGNYYIYPEFNCTSRNQSGYGRLQFGLERIDEIQNDNAMANIMEKIMWKNEILNIPYSYRDERGHIHFCADAKHRIESLDWRSDNVHKIPVNAEGAYVDIDGSSLEARQVREYYRCYRLYIKGIETGKNQSGYEKYMEYLLRCDLNWVYKDENFEALRYGLIKHYRMDGTIDKLINYYNGNEKPLRDDSNIWTTALCISVNCTKKRMQVKFWENPNMIIRFQW